MASKDTGEGAGLRIDPSDQAEHDYQVAVGPGVAEGMQGLVNATLASLYVDVNVPDTQVFVQVSTDANHSWTDIPNNQWVNVRVSGQQGFTYRLQFPAGIEVMLYIGVP